MTVVRTFLTASRRLSCFLYGHSLVGQQPGRAAGPAGLVEGDVPEKAICNGRLTLTEGQAQILRDWTH